MPISLYSENVRDLIHRPGEMRERDREFAVPEELGAGLLTVKAGENLRLDVRLESIHEGILASVSVKTVARGICGRCLKDLKQDVKVEFQELFAYSLDEAYEYEVHGDYVDLEPPLRDAVVLSLPFQPVCQPECLGLDPVTGEEITEASGVSAEPDIDPRWAALTELAASTDRGEDTESTS
ncbi:YceD family protein [Klugiella xanthotipulae]|uniref:DUF177 domain-containing protein n=1 Tax=Klugiella xanthotipulae TaxID=244735 RepID=A0A543HRS8_9MICO|nr:DUF177 domain-containing protein [Klugiella xanthotipulae]TQM61055.1 uncharacterized protein FB466_1982 [Klugiella xanthotipulae]